MIRILPEVSQKQKKTLYNTIKDNAAGEISYYFLVLLAAIVATFGLLSDSTAIIIGAMLISPIMNPIIGMSYAISTGDAKLFRKAFKSLILGSLLAIVISVFVTLLVPTRSLTSEILSRTEPTIIDLVIAFASGLAGAYTMISNKDMTILPGVAIATALMPPLCVVGSGLALGSYSVALGGILLFSANLIAINLAAAVIFVIMGCSTKKSKSNDDDDDEDTPADEYRHRRFLISIVLFVLISIPLTYFMYNTINTENTGKTIDTALDTIVSTFEDVDLVNYTYELSDSTYYINTVVRSDTKLNGNDIIEIENYLETELNKPVEVTMKIIFATEINALTTVDTEEPVIVASDSTSSEETEDNDQTSDVTTSDDTSDSAADATTVPDVDQTPSDAYSSSMNTDKLIQYTIEEKCALIDAQLLDFSFSYSSESAIYTINADIMGDADEITTIEESITTVLEDRLNRKINLTVEITENTEETPTSTSSSSEIITSEENEDDIYDIEQP